MSESSIGQLSVGPGPIAICQKCMSRWEECRCELAEGVARAIYESRYPFSWEIVSRREPGENLADDVAACRRDANAAIAAMEGSRMPLAASGSGSIERPSPNGCTRSLPGLVQAVAWRVE
jgi:hypothetical protein